jgi:nucleoside-diphosphate-sugar epimerase
MLTPQTEYELDDLLSTPTESVIEAMGDLDGDLLVLGVSGKMGPSLARLARRASEAAGTRRRIIGAGRFSRPGIRQVLDRAGVETIACDLLADSGFDALPDVDNVLYLIGQKFGTAMEPTRTWATNAYVSGAAMQRFPGARWVVLSTGNVYAMSPAGGRGAAETDPAKPAGDYAQSALARERIVEFFSRRNQTPAAVLRLNYAVELRYGVLRDIADRVYRREPLDLSMGWVNLIWQRDANARILGALAHAATPPLVLNLTGDKVGIRNVAQRFGKIWDIEPRFIGTESDTALLSDPGRSYQLFGPPDVSLEQMIEWVAGWVGAGGKSLERPTHFEERHGRF